MQTHRSGTPYPKLSQYFASTGASGLFCPLLPLPPGGLETSTRWWALEWEWKWPQCRDHDVRRGQLASLSLIHESAGGSCQGGWHRNPQDRESVDPTMYHSKGFQPYHKGLKQQGLRQTGRLLGDCYCSFNLSHVQPVTPWTAAYQASLSFTVQWSWATLNSLIKPLALTLSCHHPL